MSTIKNNPSLAGQLAATKELFGDWHRYAVAPVHTRLDAVCWFVWDANTPDPLFPDMPAIIRQEATREAAIAGL